MQVDRGLPKCTNPGARFVLVDLKDNITTFLLQLASEIYLLWSDRRICSYCIYLTAVCQDLSVLWL